MIDFVKTITDKPVVGVGRFTSPDTMVSQIRRGILDFIGGARPSIADPFLPAKIDEGREADIRECIGCNICISSWHDGVWVRCTQNPTAGEEWRRGWHPEKVARDKRRLCSHCRRRTSGPRGGPHTGKARLSCFCRREAAEFRRQAAVGRRPCRVSRRGNRVAEYRLGQLRQLANVSLSPRVK